MVCNLFINYFITDFFPYNESNGDERLLPHAIDLSYGPRKLEVPVNIFNTLEYDLYVSRNECYYKIVVFTFICEYRYRLMDSFHFGIHILHIGPDPSQNISQVLEVL